MKLSLYFNFKILKEIELDLLNYKQNYISQINRVLD